MEKIIMVPLTNSASEGDVETQILLPMLTRSDLLGIPSTDIRSKSSISSLNIGKGNQRKIGYIPDYVVYKQSLPVLVIEAKSPTKDLKEAYKEARLYATEINSNFATNVNPCSLIMSVNGKGILAGHWDSEPIISISIEDIITTGKTFRDLLELLGNERLEEISAPISAALHDQNFKRPFNQGGGAAQISSLIEPNTFAADLSPILRRYFSSREQNTDEEIYKWAYISSNEITGYDRILESFLKDRLSRSKNRTEIVTTKKSSDEISQSISSFDRLRPLGGDLQLITGGVGTGKSLFARRYKELLQPADLKNKNHWSFVNFNNAPPDHSDWANWVCEEFVKSLLEEGAPIDLTNSLDQERIFANNLEDRKAYYARMNEYEAGRDLLERARDIEEWRVDSQKITIGLARYLQGDRGDNIIVVFDNVDRRDATEQLTAFQTALWFMDQTRCLVILQMRDSTFEAYKNEPPLDTYRTGQIFHISAPRFVDVVKKRLELSVAALEREAPKQIEFQTSSGATIKYPKKRAGEFLKGVYTNLFQKPNNVSRVLEALAGRNVRRALDMFMAIITSGHMPENIIASVAQGSGFNSFPEFRILRALMRQDYRFFNENSGFIANIFYCENNWVRPSNLLIPEILFFLISQRKMRGDNGQMGYVAQARLIAELEIMGFVKSDVLDATHFCLAKNLIEVETSSSKIIRERDSVKATASGWAHMRILSSRVEYLSAVLPTTPLNDSQLNAKVFDYMQTENRMGYVNFHHSVQEVESFFSYLRKQKDRLSSHPGFKDRDVSGSKYVLEKIEEAIQFAKKENVNSKKQEDWLDK